MQVRKKYIPDWDPNLVKEKLPFKLCFVRRNGRSCRRCDWIKICTGCEEISYDDEEMLLSSNHQNHTIAIDWNNEIFQKNAPNRYNIKYGQQVTTHESVTRLMDLKHTETTTPDRIEHCLRMLCSSYILSNLGYLFHHVQLLRRENNLTQTRQVPL